MIGYIKELLAKLCATPTVSGYEGLGADGLIALLAPEFDEHRRTAAGNYLFFKRCGRKSAPLILVDTHIDEIGMMVTKVCEDGFLKFAPIGGIDTRILSGADVTVYGKERVRGVITARAPHLMSREEAVMNPDIDKLYIDTGKDREWLEENAGIGTAVGFEYPTTELLNGRIASHGLDNKACIAAALAAVKMLDGEKLACDIALMLSVREELGGAMGALTGGFELMPNVALVLDVNFAFMPENPGADTAMYRKTVELGEGTAISLSAVTDRKLTRELLRIADEEGISHQTIVEAGATGTNADRLALVKEGIPVAVVSVPLHNMHTYSEVVSADDIYETARLICAYVKRGAVHE
ncbi:MAG: M20/M25/M40 family metallo-hydrolase [Clostridia bacterium]|nr:M20/M25/M40 family metallo-hydrolase [Clostridia bacterium]